MRRGRGSQKWPTLVFSEGHPHTPRPPILNLNKLHSNLGQMQTVISSYVERLPSSLEEGGKRGTDNRWDQVGRGGAHL